MRMTLGSATHDRRNAHTCKRDRASGHACMGSLRTSKDTLRMTQTVIGGIIGLIGGGIALTITLWTLTHRE